MSDQPEYELDDDTRILVISLLEIAIMASNVQLDPKHQESIINIATVVGARFGIDIDFTQIVCAKSFNKRYLTFVFLGKSLNAIFMAIYFF